MAMLQPNFMQADDGDPEIEYSAQDFRLAITSSTYSREGVLAPELGQLRVSQRGAGPNMSVDIAAGFVVIEGDDVSDQGKYLMQSTATENRDEFADGTSISAPGSGARTHRMVARVKDKLHNGLWSGYEWEFELLQDDGSGTPDVPDSAVHLAFVDIEAGQSSITDADISNDPPRASVGTPARQGDFGAVYSGFEAVDSTRPLRWSVNPDGWVQLSGWVQWTDQNDSVSAGEQRTFGGSPLDHPAVRPPGIRDFCGATVYGAMHYAVHPDGHLSFRPASSITLTAAQGGESWFSFDGCFYRI